jgi:hypothetical protein
MMKRFLFSATIAAARAGSRAIPAVARGAAIREMHAAQGIGPPSGTNASPLTSDFWPHGHPSDVMGLVASTGHRPSG